MNKLQSNFIAIVMFLFLAGVVVGDIVSSKAEIVCEGTPPIFGVALIAVIVTFILLGEIKCRS